MLAVDHLVFHPDDVVGQGCDLFGRKAHAHAEVQRLLAAQGVVHQVLELGFVIGQAGDEALAGTLDDGLLDQALLVEAIAQALPAGVGVVVEVAQQVVGAEELLEVGEGWVGLYF